MLKLRDDTILTVQSYENCKCSRRGLWLNFILFVFSVDDDQVPLIQGFSDDEPLVTA